MSVTLSNIKERVEKSLYIVLEAITAGAGYGVIKGNYQPTDVAAFDNDMAAIKATKGFCIDIYGESAPQDKGTKSVPRFVIVSQRFLEGDIGGQIEPDFVRVDPNNYNQVIQSNLASNLSVDIHLAYDTADQGRILHAILGVAIGKRNYLQYYDDLTQRFLARQISFNDLSDTAVNLVEKVYTYEIPDLYESAPQIQRTGIKPTIQISVDIKDLETEVTIDNKTVEAP